MLCTTSNSNPQRQRPGITIMAMVTVVATTLVAIASFRMVFTTTLHHVAVDVSHIPLLRTNPSRNETISEQPMNPTLDQQRPQHDSHRRLTQQVDGAAELPALLQPASAISKMPIAPFQIQLIHSDDDAAMTSYDEMMALQTTQVYLSSVFRELQPSLFMRLEMFQFVRDYPKAEKQHVTKIAYRGNAYFRDANHTASSADGSADDAMTRGRMDKDIMLSMVGQNVTVFMNMLQSNGLKDVRNVSLMSVDGRMMDFRDGEVGYMDADDAGASTDTDAQSPKSTSMKRTQRRDLMLGLCIGIPGFIIFLSIGSFVVRWTREVAVHIPRQPGDPEHVLWKSSHHRSRSESNRPNRDHRMQEIAEEKKEEERADEDKYTSRYDPEEQYMPMGDDEMQPIPSPNKRSRT